MKSFIVHHMSLYMTSDLSHVPKTTHQPANARTNVTPQTHAPVCFWTVLVPAQKKKIGSSRRSVTIGVQGTLFQSSASRQTPPAKLLRVSAWECEEILCQKRASKLYEHHWKSHMSGTLPQPEPQDGTKMLRTDSRTDIPQATRTGLVRSPSCSPISWRWKPLAMIASMASHKSFTTWHSALIQLKTIAKHLALPKLNNVDWKGDEFTCKLTYAYHKLSQTNITEINYCIIVALPSYTSLNLLELGQNPRFVAWKESDYSLGPLWLIAISAISAIKRRPGMVCSFAGVIFLWLWFNPALGRMWMDLAWLLSLKFKVGWDLCQCRTHSEHIPSLIRRDLLAADVKCFALWALLAWRRQTHWTPATPTGKPHKEELPVASSSF